MIARRRSAPRVVEPVPIQDIFASGLMPVEEIDGDTVRLVYYRDRRLPCGTVVHEIVACIVMSRVSYNQSLLDYGEEFSRVMMMGLCGERH